MTQMGEEGLQLVQWNEVKQLWQTITTRIDTRSNVIYGETRHLSIFGVTRRATPCMHANISFYPEALNVQSQGRWLNALIELPEGLNVHEIDISSLTLNQSIPTDLKAPAVFGDFNNDNTPDVMVAFNRTLVIEYILSGEVADGPTALLITGELLGVAVFEGISTIMVSGLSGDVNGDGAVTLFDVISASASYGSKEGEPRWNPNANFAPSWNIIDIYDIVTIACHYGESSNP